METWHLLPQCPCPLSAFPVTLTRLLCCRKYELHTVLLLHQECLSKVSCVHKWSLWKEDTEFIIGWITAKHAARRWNKVCHCACAFEGQIYFLGPPSVSASWAPRDEQFFATSLQHAISELESTNHRLSPPKTISQNKTPL